MIWDTVSPICKVVTEQACSTTSELNEKKNCNQLMYLSYTLTSPPLTWSIPVNPLFFFFNYFLKLLLFFLQTICSHVFYSLLLRAVKHWCPLSKWDTCRFHLLFLLLTPTLRQTRHTHELNTMIEDPFQV